MSWGVALAGAGAAGTAAGFAPPAIPPRVMSMNLCTDQLVLALVPPARITSVSWLARDAHESYLSAAARRVAVNYGTVEEVARQHPDLVIAGTYTTPATRALLRRVGYRLLELAPADTFDEIRARTRELAAAVGEMARGEELVAAMDDRLAWLAHHPPAARVRVVAWDGSGASPGRGTLYDSILSAAGARNVAAEEGLTAYDQYDIEALLRSAPDVLIQGAAGFVTPGRRNDVAHHALVARLWAERRIEIPQALYVCGTPFAADAAGELRQALERYSATDPKPLSLARSGSP